MPVNQKHTTIASYNYLLEVGSIPIHVRSEYIQKLLKRKNACSQVNIKVIRLITEYVDQNNISMWDPDRVCKTAGITTNALYIHKSRFLKGLREYYFNWSATEKTIKETINNEYIDKQVSSDVEKNKLYILEKARKMAAAGMLREAKLNYHKLEMLYREQDENAVSKPVKNYKELSEIYEYLSYFYFNKRQKSKVQYYTNKLNELAGSIKPEMNISGDESALLNTRMYYTRYYHYALSWYVNPKTQMAENYPELIYSLSKKFSIVFYLLKILHSSAILELTKGNYTRAKEICNEGFEIAGKNRNKTARYTFASMLYFIKSKTSNEYKKISNDNIIKYYYEVKRTAPFSLWTHYLENSIVMSITQNKREEMLGIFHRQVASNIMYGDFSFSVFWKFSLDSEMYTDKIISYFNNYNLFLKGYLELRKIDDSLLDNIKKICLNTECYHKKINDFGLQWLVQKLKLTSYYFREDGYVYDEVFDQLKVMEHLKKKSKIKQGIKNYELLKLGLAMLEFEHDPNKLLNRYELKFKKTIEDFKNNPQEFTITDYAIISSLARRLRCKEITAIVKDLYRWLEANHPEILAPALREIEERASKVKLIDGSKQSAA